MMTGLYVGFIGRIVLEDFRDLVGDRLFGKRTWLVCHGHAVACNLIEHDTRARSQERPISTIAICGRRITLVLLAQFTLVRTDLSSPYRVAALAGLTIVLLGQARSMARHGPPLKPAPDWAHASITT